VTLRRNLDAVPGMKEIFGESGQLDWLNDQLKPHPEVVSLISEAIADEPAASPGEGEVIRPGFSEELDNFRSAVNNARRHLANLERQEKEKTGIKSLKIGFNNVFGYYIEVSKANLGQVPQEYIRKQTLVNGERYFTPEPKEYESLILNGRERIDQLETTLYQQICHQVAVYGDGILALADALAHIDVFSSLAEVAIRDNYVCPELTSGNVIVIKQGRHPVVERS
ncbi:MAG: DNA mismatch repair protein MutS, partial [Dehalococcoidales bacterium]